MADENDIADAYITATASIKFALTAQQIKHTF
jgi:hypothetical protein